MKYAFVIAPLFVVASVSAQVPAQPPKAPPAPKPMATTITPSPMWVDVAPFANMSLNYDVSLQHAYALEDMASRFSDINFSYANDYAFNELQSISSSIGSSYSWGGNGPVAYAQSDPADSLYRQARDQFNRGDYRRAADLFRSLPQKYATSVYVADAQYWQAFSLYRIGGTPELQQALAVLEARKPTPAEQRVNWANPVARSSNSGVTYVSSDKLSYTFGPGSRMNDAAGLAARIANVLSSRGMSGDAAVKRALAAGGNTCDPDEQSVKMEALGALMQNDAETARQMAVKILANKDECSVPLRRNAVMLVGNKHDDAATSTLIPVAKSDPSPMVRTQALDYLIRLQTDAAINAVIDIARSSDDKQVQRAAVRSLAQSTNPRARTEVRGIVESSTADETLRVSVIDGIDRDKVTPEDAAWLRSLYAKTTSNRVRERIVSALARAGGEANNQWLLNLVRNDDESLDSRTVALERLGQTMDIVTLNKMYDVAAQRPIRMTILDLLSQRKEPEALDKIVEVAKSGTDIEMRRHAINLLSRSKDPRASKLLLQLVDH